jgi:hypothetical protein
VDGAPPHARTAGSAPADNAQKFKRKNLFIEGLFQYHSLLPSIYRSTMY